MVGGRPPSKCRQAGFCRPCPPTATAAAQHRGGVPASAGCGAAAAPAPARFSRTAEEALEGADVVGAAQTEDDACRPGGAATAAGEDGGRGC